MIKILLLGVYIIFANFVVAESNYVSSQIDTDLNIPDPIEVSKDNVKAYAAYSYLADVFKNTSDLTASPCDDFFNYTCKNMAFGDYFDYIQLENMKHVVRGLEKDRDIPWFRAVKKSYTACLKRQSAEGGLHQHGKALRNIFGQVFDEFGPIFPLMERSSNVAIDSAKLGEFIGFLAQKFGLHTFFSYEIQGDKLVINEPRLAFPERYFVKAFNKFETEYKASIRDYLIQLSEALGKPVDQVQFNRTIDEVVKFENDLAQLLNKVSDEVPVGVQASELSRKTDAINFSSYLARISKNAGNKGLLNSNNIKIHMTSPSKVKLVQTYLSQANTTTILNYLNIRLARNLRKYFIRKPKECVADQWLREGAGVKTNTFRPIPQPDPYPTESKSKEVACAEEAKWRRLYAIDRVFLDETLPTKEERKEFVDRIKLITNKVINGFRFQIDQLSWFSPATKVGAYKKIDSMLYHVVYDDWIENDDILNEKYPEIIGEEDDDFTAHQKANDIAQSILWEGLIEPNRSTRFSYSIMTVNAWYVRTQNQFFIPLGILQKPFFDINYPIALQYGAMGYIIGHELTHGFDSVGVHYDNQGNKKDWMDKPSEQAFNKMARCVIAQYNKIHGMGRETQTEDIADNGGIRAAYNAYKAEQGLYGSDPQLPGAPWNTFTHDQLFFLGFARDWCVTQRSNGFEVGLHSAPTARVLGTIQNTPAFQAAFNCPVGSKYAPKEHCDVWASEVKIN